MAIQRLENYFHAKQRDERALSARIMQTLIQRPENGSNEDPLFQSLTLQIVSLRRRLAITRFKIWNSRPTPDVDTNLAQHHEDWVALHATELDVLYAERELGIDNSVHIERKKANLGDILNAGMRNPAVVEGKMWLNRSQPEIFDPEAAIHSVPVRLNGSRSSTWGLSRIVDSPHNPEPISQPLDPIEVKEAKFSNPAIEASVALLMSARIVGTTSEEDVLNLSGITPALLEEAFDKRLLTKIPKGNKTFYNLADIFKALEFLRLKQVSGEDAEVKISSDYMQSIASGVNYLKNSTKPTI